LPDPCSPSEGEGSAPLLLRITLICFFSLDKRPIRIPVYINFLGDARLDCGWAFSTFYFSWIERKEAFFQQVPWSFRLALKQLTSPGISPCSLCPLWLIIGSNGRA
jgi:hypothetical protein